MPSYPARRSLDHSGAPSSTGRVSFDVAAGLYVDQSGREGFAAGASGAVSAVLPRLRCFALGYEQSQGLVHAPRLVLEKSPTSIIPTSVYRLKLIAIALLRDAQATRQARHRLRLPSLPRGGPQPQQRMDRPVCKRDLSRRWRLDQHRPDWNRACDPDRAIKFVAHKNLDRRPAQSGR